MFSVCSAAHKGLQYQWRIQDLKKGAYILANLRDFLKNLAKIGGGVPTATDYP